MQTTSPGQTWAGSHRYQARGLVRPTSVAELQDLVATSERVRALGSRHSFTAIADTDGYLVDLGGLPGQVEVDAEHGVAWVSGGLTYAEVARALDARGWALRAMASLPHISVAGAVATGTHGSGDSIGSLASDVAALELVAADGSLHLVERGDPDFEGYPVSLGALGVVTRLCLDVVPTFQVRQDVMLGLSWTDLHERIDAILGSAYSVSVFTDWHDPDRTQVWLKSRVSGDGAAPVLAGTTAASSASHMLRGGEIAALTAQLGVSGVWHERLPHFRAQFTPSRGAELQTEYFVPRRHASAAVSAVREVAATLGERLQRVLQVSELRSIAGDDLWLSGAYGEPVIGLHCTWQLDQPAVDEILPEIEAALAELGVRPHWGKCFTMHAADIATRYPRLRDFAALRDRLDPDRRFDNAFLRDRVGL